MFRVRKSKLKKSVKKYANSLKHSEVDGEHTEEDTLKLMEATSRCLKHEMSKYLSASWKTFGKRQVLAVQCVNNTITLMCSKRVERNKWCFVEQRSTIVPRDWNDRFFWVKVMEFLLKLKVNYTLKYIPSYIISND